ncbi:MAG TPA: SpoIIE family protein phosphatase [Mycobacteriales bacterium]|nr:SpoIIE family protein phosphatase [Mycobacteriales bacterium]
MTAGPADDPDLAELAPCGLLSTEPGGLIVRVNATFLSWTGYDRADLVGRRRFQDLLSPGGRIYHETHYAPLLFMQGSVREIAVELVRADGSRLPALVNSSVQADAEGKPVLVRTAVFPAGDRRGYEQELLRARRDAEEAATRARLLAQTLQESLIPPELPRIPGLQVAGRYRPAGTGDEVGGDFYDVFATGDDWAVVVGDVCGKGAPAAVVTSLARHTVRGAAVRTRMPKTALAAVNNALLRQPDPARFCSLVHARLRRDPAGRLRLTVASGGHPLPLVVGAAGRGGPVGVPGTVLGVVARPRLHDTTVELRPGDVALFYTDGVTEARRDGEFYDDDRLLRTLTALRGEDAGTIAERIGAEVVGFQGGLPRDDIALVVLRVPV